MIAHVRDDAYRYFSNRLVITPKAPPNRKHNEDCNQHHVRIGHVRHQELEQFNFSLRRKGHSHTRLPKTHFIVFVLGRGTKKQGRPTKRACQVIYLQSRKLLSFHGLPQLLKPLKPLFALLQVSCWSHCFHCITNYQMFLKGWCYWLESSRVSSEIDLDFFGHSHRTFSVQHDNTGMVDHPSAFAPVPHNGSTPSKPCSVSSTPGRRGERRCRHFRVTHGTKPA
jgi:hypothetical protein